MASLGGLGEVLLHGGDDDDDVGGHGELGEGPLHSCGDDDVAGLDSVPDLLLKLGSLLQRAHK